MIGRLDRKVAVVTGGNSGIGLAAAKAFAKEGAKVVITGRNQATLTAAQQSIGNGTVAIQADVAHLDDIESAFKETAVNHGNIDVLFVNAGTVRFAPIEAVTEADYDLLMNVNVKGAYFTIQKALPYLNEGASIILNASINANIGMPTTSIYAAGKAALLSFARTLSSELISRKIRVNAISPGPIETPIFSRSGLNEEQINGFAAQIMEKAPLGRFGHPDEIANVALFLASDDSSFIVGEEIIVDGGMSMSAL